MEEESDDLLFSSLEEPWESLDVTKIQKVHLFVIGSLACQIKIVPWAGKVRGVWHK